MKRFFEFQRRAILRQGYIPIPARWDEAGNCTVCGESGRCPGWHRGEQATIPGTERRQVPLTARRRGEDRGLSGLPLSPEGQEAMKTEQGKLF